jgi:hypothetical protein
MGIRNPGPRNGFSSITEGAFVGVLTATLLSFALRVCLPEFVESDSTSSHVCGALIVLLSLGIGIRQIAAGRSRSGDR